MLNRLSRPMITVVAAAAVGAVTSGTPRSAVQALDAPTAAAAVKTPWGEPDLQGIWTDEFDTPLQRPAKWANQEFFTAAQREELDNARSDLLGRRAGERGNAGVYNPGIYNLTVFTSTKRTGARTSLVVDPPNGRSPPLTPEAQKRGAADREFFSPCCERLTRARVSRRSAAAGHMIRRPRRDARTFLLATTPGASTATTVRRTPRRRIAA